MSIRHSNAVDPSQRPPTFAPEALFVLTSVLTSVAGAGLLGETMRIRWTIGTFYGPTHAPTLLVLLAFPLAAAALLVGLRALASFLARRGEFPADARVFRLGSLTALGTVLVVQVLLIGLNVAA